MHAGVNYQSQRGYNTREEEERSIIQSNINHQPLTHSYHPSSPSVGATDTTLGVGDATRFGVHSLTYLDAGGVNTDRLVMGAFLRLDGACIESYTDVCGGVSARRPLMLVAVGVAARLGYTVLVLVRESGRGGEDTTAAEVVVAVVRLEGRPVLSAAMSCATRASSAATWSRNLFSRS